MSFVPVIYCGYLVYYFYNLSGSMQEVENNGLGPTVWGLAIVGLLFCIPLVVKLALVFIELRKPKLSVDGGPSGGSSHKGEGNFDADAVIARYVAQRRAQADSPATPAGGTASRPSFGQKTGNPLKS